jgi:hypothetical protein
VVKNICNSGKRKEGMKLSLTPKLVEKLVWVPVLSFCKISFPVKHLIPYYAETGRSLDVCKKKRRGTGGYAS